MQEYQIALNQGAKKVIQKKLWNEKIKAVDVSNYTEYDLLVEDRVRVKVWYAGYSLYHERIVWDFPKMKTKEFDVLAVIFAKPLGLTPMYGAISRYSFSRTEGVRLDETQLAQYGFSRNPNDTFGEAVGYEIQTVKKNPVLKKGHWYSMSETAKLLSCSVFLVKKLVEEGKLKEFSLGRGKEKRYEFRAKDIAKHLEKNS